MRRCKRPRSLQPELAAIAAYIDHGNADAPLALDVSSTAFQQQVWQALAAIPAGQTRSYGELARQLGAPDASRAVAGACAANVLAVAIPAIAWCGAMARYPAIAGASNASARCSRRRARPMMPETCAMAPDLNRHDWEAIARALDARAMRGCPACWTPRNARLAAGYASPDGYRSRIVMARHGFGQGEYKYFLPAAAAAASAAPALYPRLAPIANRWNQLLGDPQRFPATHDAFLAQCHAAGQKRPTPLILQYGARRLQLPAPGPVRRAGLSLQVAILLSRPGRDFSGGEFVMTETASSGQRAEVIALDQGDALLFTVNHRPAPGKRGSTQGRHAPWREPRARQFAPYRGSDFHDAR